MRKIKDCYRVLDKGIDDIQQNDFYLKAYSDNNIFSIYHSDFLLSFDYGNVLYEEEYKLVGRRIQNPYIHRRIKA